jgi:50S ribosomal protein L16 3-hydroxylase
MSAAHVLEIDGSGHPPLGMTPELFLAEYWQKRPLLIRNAFAGFVSPVSPDELAGLACEEAALSRLVRHRRKTDDYTLETGPFSEATLTGLPRRDWTLLVQDVDKWDAEVRALLAHFDFLPRWRMDDVMISFAAPGGSVGAHVDQYDVFLLQAMGRRRWQIDDRPGALAEYRADSELRLLKSFTPNREWLLEPGDMLYLPPGVAHHGVAEPPGPGAGETARSAPQAEGCMTYSFGMRAPSHAELLLDLAETLAAGLPETLRYADPELTPPADPGEIDATALGRLRAALPMFAGLDEDTLRDWFGRFITTWRSAGEPVPPGKPPGEAALTAALAAGGVLSIHPFARMAWARAGRGARLYAHGLAYPMTVGSARRLASAQTLDAAAVAALDARGHSAVLELLARGIYSLIRARQPRARGARK